MHACLKHSCLVKCYFFCHSQMLANTDLMDAYKLCSVAKDWQHLKLHFKVGPKTAYDSKVLKHFTIHTTYGDNRSSVGGPLACYKCKRGVVILGKVEESIRRHPVGLLQLIKLEFVCEVRRGKARPLHGSLSRAHSKAWQRSQEKKHHFFVNVFLLRQFFSCAQSFFVCRGKFHPKNTLFTKLHMR